MDIERELRKGIIRTCEDCGQLFRPSDAGDPDEVCHVCKQYIQHMAATGNGIWRAEQDYQDGYGR